MGWEVVAIVAAVGSLLLWYAGKRRRLRRAANQSAYAALLRKAQRHAGANSVTDRLLRQYRQTGRLSKSDLAHLDEIAGHGEQRRLSSTFLGEIGEDIAVEGELLSIEYSDDATTRIARHILAAHGANVIYTGPVSLGRIHNIVRFNATVVQHRVSEFDPWDTVIDDVRDVVVIKEHI